MHAVGAPEIRTACQRNRARPLLPRVWVRNVQFCFDDPIHSEYIRAGVARYRNYTLSRKKKKDLNNVMFETSGTTSGHNFYMGTQNESKLERC